MRRRDVISAWGVIESTLLRLECEHLHHGRDDRHESGEPCKAKLRVIEKARVLRDCIREKLTKEPSPADLVRATQDGPHPAVGAKRHHGLKASRTRQWREARGRRKP